MAPSDEWCVCAAWRRETRTAFTRQVTRLSAATRAIKKPRPDTCVWTGLLEKTWRYLLSHFWYYHRPEKLNYCVRDGYRCFLFGMFARRKARGGEARTHLVDIVITRRARRRHVTLTIWSGKSDKLVCCFVLH